jgi:hypothetical protein
MLCEKSLASTSMGCVFMHSCQADTTRDNFLYILTVKLMFLLFAREQGLKVYPFNGSTKMQG